MLIDCHVHASARRSLVEKSAGNRPLPDELIGMMDANGIDKAIVLSVVSPECRTFFNTSEDTLEVCRQYPERLYPFCGLDARMARNSPDSDFGPMLETYKKAGFKGVGEYICHLPFDHPMNLNLFHQLEDANFPLTFHIGPTEYGCYGCYDDLGLPRLEKVLKECPRLTMLGHSQPFWAEISADVTPETRNTYPTGPVEPGRTVELMRRYPNLLGDLSAGSGLNAISRDPEFGYAFLEEFQDRLFFGTDICCAGQELPTVPYFRKLNDEKLISAEAWEKITWKNAARLLGT